MICNGSGHSIRLGNSNTGREVDACSYTFTIPAGQNQFSLIYYYAVVVQDGGSTGSNPHTPEQQPRLNIKITNVSTNTEIGCSSFSFVASASIPGFKNSPLGTALNPILYKDWSAASINLDGYQGQTIRLYFESTDCSQGGHFGYGYVDVNTECSSSFVGAAYCRGDTAIDVKGPSGYQGYRWFNSNYSQILGTSQTLHLSPPPPPGTTVNVEVSPYSGYGCLDTLTAELLDTLKVSAHAGKDTFVCNGNSVQLGIPGRNDLQYHWEPATGLSNPDISNPIATPAVTTTYVLHAKSMNGGCEETDTVLVGASALNNALSVTGPRSGCLPITTPTVLSVLPGPDSVQWFLNSLPIAGATQLQYSPTLAGSYNAVVFSNQGCSLPTVPVTILLYPTPVPSVTPNPAAPQCLSGNLFSFTNNSNVSSGTPLQYAWDFGDGTLASTRDAAHIYSTPGSYETKMIVSSDGGCKDSVKMTIVVHPSPDTTLTLTGNDHYCVNHGQSVLSVPPSANIQWFNAGGAITGANQQEYNAMQTGDYFATITNAQNCTSSTSIKTITVNAQPKAGFTVNNLGQCLGANQFVLTDTSSILPGTTAGPVQYLWTLGDGSMETTANVSHSYAASGRYNVKVIMTTPEGCVDSAKNLMEVFRSPTADFKIQPVCVNLNVLAVNQTVNNSTSVVRYLWDFGNGQTSTSYNPAYAYPVAGTYPVKLSVSTVQCPADINTKEIRVDIDAPAPGITYPVQNAILNFPLVLNSRDFGGSVTWDPAVNLDRTSGAAPTFRGFTDQLYTIAIKTKTGCLTVDTQLVKTYKKIKIHVPNVFTPNGDGKNDLLRPLLMSFKEVRYFRVFNRWGNLLFEMKNDRPGWDGRFKGNSLETQTVIWMIEAVDVDGKVHQEKGTTVLQR